MPETEDTTTEQQDETPNGDTTDKGGDNLGEGGQKALAAERDARKAAEKQLRDAQKALKAYEDRGKTDAEKSAERIAELERALADKDSVIAAKDRDTERAKVAAEKGVPLNLVTGSTREEMEAAADAALEWRGGNKTSTSELRKQGLRSGATAPPDGSTPQQKAAAALRAMRAGQ